MSALVAKLGKGLGGIEVIWLLAFLLVVVVAFGLVSPQFLTVANFGSIAFQVLELGLLTLAMLMPIISGGFNIAIIYTANISGLTLAWVLHLYGGPEAPVWAFALGSAAALAVGSLAGFIMGLVVAYMRCPRWPNWRGCRARSCRSSWFGFMGRDHGLG